MTSTFLLVHGAFRGGWQWDAVRALLAADGHVVHAPDLPGAGERVAELDRGAIGLEDHLDDLEAFVRDLDLRAIVLVGHSQGGFIARALTQRIPDRVRVLGLLDAPDPRHGDRAVDFGPAMPQLPPRELVIPPTPLAAGSGMTDDEAVAFSRRLTPQHVAIALDGVVLTDERALALPTRWAFCRNTPENYPCRRTRDDLDAHAQAFDWVDAPHDAPLYAPEATARWLRSLSVR